MRHQNGDFPSGIVWCQQNASVFPGLVQGLHSQRVEVPTALNQGWMLKDLSIECIAMIYLRRFYVDQLTLLVTFELVTFFKLLPHLIIFSAKIYSKN